MTAANRRQADKLVDLVNKGIEDTVRKVADEHEKRSWWKGQHPSTNKSAKKQVQFINFDKHFEGRRFCEQNNAKDPIGSNNPNVFFNDLLTVLPVPGKAVGENTIGGVDIQDQLQQITAFHPKGAAPYRGLVAEIAWKVLSDAEE